MKRSTALPLWLGLTLIAFVFAGQPWYRVIYDFDGHNRELKASGLESWQVLTGFLWLQLAAFILVIFLQGKAKQVFAWCSAAITLLLGAFLCLPIFNTMSPALAAKISAKSGITMPANQVVGGPVTYFATTAHAGIFVLVLILLVIVQIFTARGIPKWKTRNKGSRFESPLATEQQNSASGEPEDPIQIWDSQRK